MSMPNNIIVYIQSDLKNDSMLEEYKGMVKVLEYIK